MPDFSFEKSIWEKGFPLVVGVDEVGRGALAGPVVAAAAASRIQISDNRIQKEIIKLGIDDSKRLTPKLREELAAIIPNYFHIGIGEASVGEINTIGIVRATERAMKRAIHKCMNVYPEHRRARMQQWNNEDIYLLIDGNHRIPEINNLRQQPIIDGDAKSISIAAASIMAKVYRDHLMRKLSKRYNGYGWDHNVGYGTSYHFDALIKHGVTILHRELFVDFLPKT